MEQKNFFVQYNDKNPPIKELAAEIATTQPEHTESTPTQVQKNAFSKS